MKFKKKMVLVLMMALCSSMLLVSCKNADEGKKIEKMLEDIYGGNFTLTDSVAVRPTIYFFQSPITSHYQYYYKWDLYWLPLASMRLNWKNSILKTFWRAWM